MEIDNNILAKLFKIAEEVDKSDVGDKDGQILSTPEEKAKTLAKAKASAELKEFFANQTELDEADILAQLAKFSQSAGQAEQPAASSKVTKSEKKATTVDAKEKKYCIDGYTLEGDKCIKIFEVDAIVKQYCPNGWTLNGDICEKN